MQQFFATICYCHFPVKNRYHIIQKRAGYVAIYCLIRRPLIHNEGYHRSYWSVRRMTNRLTASDQKLAVVAVRA